MSINTFVHIFSEQLLFFIKVSESLTCTCNCFDKVFFRSVQRIVFKEIWLFKEVFISDYALIFAARPGNLQAKL